MDFEFSIEESRNEVALNGYCNLPNVDLLHEKADESSPVVNRDECLAAASKIVSTLRFYGFDVVSIKATVGYAFTFYEVVLKSGTRLAKVKKIEYDLMLAMDVVGVRLICPIPEKSSIGIEAANEHFQCVSAHSVFASKKFIDTQYSLPIALGRTVDNDVFTFDLTTAQQLLIAGATGTGKSVAIYDIMLSLLFKKSPSELQFVLMDPKCAELTKFAPLAKWFLASIEGTNDDNAVVTDCGAAIKTLYSLVKEQENRYALLMDAGASGIKEYNEKFNAGLLDVNKEIQEGLHHHYLPYIVTIMEEYGDFMIQGGKKIETPIARVSQLGRSVGLHMILTTQRPSIRVVTGVIKANFPTRIALRTQSYIDSRTVMDTKGAEFLIGRGDALYSDGLNVVRLQCAYVEDCEIEAVVNNVVSQNLDGKHYELPVADDECVKVPVVEKDTLYPLLEKIFIENKIFRQPWFENAPSPEELERRTKEELERLIDGPHREITEKDIKRLLRISMSRIAHYKYKP
jgi:S-DNA-T family DNA segregation ATPase FtsK/SpoIIIE